jgi:hypothetical protein
MTVEASFNYPSDLNASYPAAGDARSEGDDHLRGLKTQQKTTWPNISGAVTLTHTQLNDAAFGAPLAASGTTSLTTAAVGRLTYLHTTPGTVTLPLAGSTYAGATITLSVLSGNGWVISRAGADVIQAYGGALSTTMYVGETLTLVSDGSGAWFSAAGGLTKERIPTFSAYQSSAQSVANGPAQKIQLQTEEWDSANAFDAATNYRFTPQVAGYYQITGSLHISGGGVVTAVIYKNGALVRIGVRGDANSLISTLIYFNGSTDYIELWGYHSSGGPQNSTNSAQSTYLQGHLARQA